MMDIEQNTINTKRISRSKSKNKNKTGHKTVPTGQFKTQVENFKQPKSNVKLINERKENRLNRTAQLRKNKINEYILKKRGIIDSDESSAGIDSSSILKNKTLSISNLTQLIDTTAYKVPPKLCALVALNNDADLDIIMRSIEFTLIDDNTDTNNLNLASIHKVSENMWTALVPPNIHKGKERISLIKTNRDIYSILDNCKVADAIIFVSSCKNTDFTNGKQTLINTHVPLMSLGIKFYKCSELKVYLNIYVSFRICQ